jgi:hypothetical protein
VYAALELSVVGPVVGLVDFGLIGVGLAGVEGFVVVFGVTTALGVVGVVGLVGAVPDVVVVAGLAFAAALAGAVRNGSGSAPL